MEKGESERIDSFLYYVNYITIFFYLGKKGLSKKFSGKLEGKNENAVFSNLLKT
jgi:hypothetical protein